MLVKAEVRWHVAFGYEPWFYAATAVAAGILVLNAPAAIGAIGPVAARRLIWEPG